MSKQEDIKRIDIELEEIQRLLGFEKVPDVDSGGYPTRLYSMVRPELTICDKFDLLLDYLGLELVSARLKEAHIRTKKEPPPMVRPIRKAM